MTPSWSACTLTQLGHLFNKEMLSVHTLMTIQTPPGSRSPEYEWQLMKQWVLILSELSMPLVAFSVSNWPGQTAFRPNSCSSFTCPCCKYLQALRPFMPITDFWACNPNNYTSFHGPAAALTQILNLVKGEAHILKDAVNAPFPNRNSAVCLSGEYRVYSMLSLNQNFSEITTGLSQSAYGSSTLK